jgi:hypothetical protein
MHVFLTQNGCIHYSEERFSLAVSSLLLVVPIYSGQAESDTATGVITVHTRATLLGVNGPQALIPLLIPVLIALMPLIFSNRWVPIVATVALGLFVFIAGFSIGLFYLPSAVNLFAASVRSLEPSASV